MENSKLYRQKLKEFSITKPALTTNVKRNSLARKKKKSTTGNKKIMNGKEQCKGKCTVNVGNHPHTNIVSNLRIMRRGANKCRIWEIYLILREQQFKTILYI